MIVGIDPSINSTGVCVYDDENNINYYYIIPSKMTKKMISFSYENIQLYPYNKIDIDKHSEYTEKEKIKFQNIYNICTNISNIIDKYNVKEVRMEGVSYGSTGSAALVDLSFLNACIRMLLKNKDISFTIISPTSLKKFVCGNGQAEKDVIVDAWKRIDNKYDIKDIKTDDLADAYFLAHYKI